MVEIPHEPLTLHRKNKPAPRLVLEISEGSAAILRCPFDNVDIEIRDYDVPEDWDVPEDIGQRESGVKMSIGVDVFGRRYQSIKFSRRPKPKKSK